jgi:hypothetical protein
VALDRRFEFGGGDVCDADGLLAVMLRDVGRFCSLLLRKEGTLLFHMIAARVAFLQQIA